MLIPVNITLIIVLILNIIIYSNINGIINNKDSITDYKKPATKLYYLCHSITGSRIICESFIKHDRFDLRLDKNVPELILTKWFSITRKPTVSEAILLYELLGNTPDLCINKKWHKIEEIDLSLKTHSNE